MAEDSRPMRLGMDMIGGDAPPEMRQDQKVVALVTQQYCHSITESGGDIMLEDISTGRTSVQYRNYSSPPSDVWVWAVVHRDDWGHEMVALAHTEKSAMKMAEAFISFSGGTAKVTLRERIFND